MSKNSSPKGQRKKPESKTSGKRVFGTLRTSKKERTQASEEALQEAQENLKKRHVERNVMLAKFLENNKTDKAIEFLNEGADINQKIDGVPLLHKAIHEDWKTVAFILNRERLNLMAVGQGGEIAVHLLAEKGQAELLDMLLKQLPSEHRQTVIEYKDKAGKSLLDYITTAEVQQVLLQYAERHKLQEVGRQVTQYVIMSQAHNPDGSLARHETQFIGEKTFDKDFLADKPGGRPVSVGYGALPSAADMEAFSEDLEKDAMADPTSHYVGIPSEQVLKEQYEQDKETRGPLPRHGTTYTPLTIEVTSTDEEGAVVSPPSSPPTLPRGGTSRNLLELMKQSPQSQYVSLPPKQPNNLLTIERTVSSVYKDPSPLKASNSSEGGTRSPLAMRYQTKAADAGPKVPQR